MPEIIHCRECNKPIRVDGFNDMMEKLRVHRKKEHPKKFKASIKKGLETRKKRG